MPPAKEDAMTQRSAAESLFLERAVECVYTYDTERFKKTIKKSNPRGHITSYSRADLPVQRTLDSADLKDVHGIENSTQEGDNIGATPWDDQTCVDNMKRLAELTDSSALLSPMRKNISLAVVSKRRLHRWRLHNKSDSAQASSHQYVVLKASAVSDSGHFAAYSSHTVDLNHMRLDVVVDELERKVTASTAAGHDNRIASGSILFLPPDITAQVLYACVGCLLRRPRSVTIPTPWPEGLAIADDPRSVLGYHQHVFDETGKPSVPYLLVDETGEQALLMSDITNGYNPYGTMRLLDGRNVMESVPSNTELRLNNRIPEQAIAAQSEYIATSLTQVVFEFLSSSGRIAFEVAAMRRDTSEYRSIARCRVSGTPEAVLDQFAYVGESVGYYPGDFSVAGSGAYLRLS